MDNQKYILTVDDEPANQLLLEAFLQGQYTVGGANNGQECLDSIRERKPDLILLDVNMPGISGLEVCRTIRDDSENKDIPIVFLSGLATDEEKMMGYESGGDDYITKPFSGDELIAKVDRLLKISDEKSELESSSNYAMKTAMSAMTTSSEIGSVLRFMQASFSCKDHQALADQIFECTNGFMIDATVIMHDKHTTHNITSDGIHRPLEESVLKQLQSKGRIYTFHDKIIYNGARASLLTKNNPMDDEDRVGRLKDNFAYLIDGIDACLMAMEIEQSLVEVIDYTQKEIAEIEQQQRKTHTAVIKEISTLGASIEESFIRLGLDNEQEDKLLTFIRQAEVNTDTLYQESAALDKRFSNIISQLKGVINKT